MPGWDPAYPAAPGDDTALSTVFVTPAHGPDTVWVVVDRSRARGASRTLPDVRAGTVNVECLPDGQATRAEITYDLTTLRATTEAALQQFADGYDTFLSEWERLIAAALEREPRPEDI